MLVYGYLDWVGWFVVVRWVLLGVGCCGLLWALAGVGCCLVVGVGC